MPIPKVDELPRIPKRERFLEELRDHCEDAGIKDIGNTEIIISSFTMYAQEYTRKATMRVILVAIIVAVWSTVSIYALLVENEIGITTGTALAMLPGWFFAAPVFLMGIMLLQLFNALQLTELTAVPVEFIMSRILLTIPLLTTLLWTSVAYMLQFNPPKFIHRFAKNQAAK